MSSLTLSKDDFWLTADERDGKLLFRIELPLSEQYSETHESFRDLLDLIETLKKSGKYKVVYEPSLT
jgi:hypothetical protein